MATAQRRAREKSLRQQAILDAARKVIFRDGFSRATMDDIAAHAEVSKGTVYLYFESKECILAHLLLEGLALLQKELEAASQGQESLSAVEGVRRLLWAYLRFSREQPDYFRLMVAYDRGRLWENVSPQLRREVLECCKANLAHLARAVQQGMETGDFLPGDAWQVAWAMWTAMDGLLVSMAHPIRREMLDGELETAFEALLDMLIRGLKEK